jgi:hypothetical protein
MAAEIYPVAAPAVAALDVVVRLGSFPAPGVPSGVVGIYREAQGTAQLRLGNEVRPRTVEAEEVVSAELRTEAQPEVEGLVNSEQHSASPQQLRRR